MRRVAAVTFIAAALAFATPCRAQLMEGLEAPLLLNADEVTYDEERGVVTATGNVEVSQSGRILLAESLSYDQRAGTVTASGEVVLLEPGGEVLFADRVELQDDLRSGVIEGIRMLFPDDSRLAANRAVRSGGDRTELSRAVFSPCDLCAEDPERPPLWQIKAVRVVHKQEAKRVDYYDAWLEVFGVPVAYTPFFSHPDPTVKRKSGFLAPRYGSSSLLGVTFEVPYYFNIAPDKDATFSPLFTSDEGVVLAGEYRQRVRQGEFQFSGSITRPEARDEEGNEIPGRDIRGHVFGVGRFRIDDTWRWGFDLARATDDTYLRRYDISHVDTLTSNLFLHGFRGRNYAAVNGYAFQGLREDDVQDETPVIWPLAEYSFVGQPARLGGRYELDLNAVNLTRVEGADSRRMSLSGGWRLPYTSPIGEVYTLSLDLHGDFYHVDHVRDDDETDGTFSGVTGRFHPQLALDWRYPFIRQQGTVSQIIEPLASFVVSPFDNNPDEIPNEDSVSVEFDDTNLFAHDRFPGFDRVEGGIRFNVGIKAGVYGAGGGSSTVLFGQSFRTEEEEDFPDKTGLDTTRSDYVGRITVSPNEHLDLVHRFRLDRDDFGFRRNEIDVLVGGESWWFAAGYVSLSRDLSVEEDLPQREVRASGRLELSDYWSADASWRRDLGDDDGTISAAFGLTYEDECFRFTTEISRSFTRDRDVEPSTSIFFQIALKYLG